MPVTYHPERVEGMTTRRRADVGRIMPVILASYRVCISPVSSKARPTWAILHLVSAPDCRLFAGIGGMLFACARAGCSALEYLLIRRCLGGKLLLFATALISVRPTKAIWLLCDDHAMTMSAIRECI